MPTNHTIEQGETTIGLSERHGLFAETIWNDPANAELKAKRKDMNVLMPGDVLHIPDRRLREVTKPPEKRHRFRRKGIPAQFRLQVFDIEEPRAGQKYVLTVDGMVLRGVTDSNGILEQFVPAGSRSGHLLIGPDDFELEIDFGCMDPATEIVGIKKRLNNLGFGCGPPDPELNDATIAALLEFQHRFGLEETGEPDDATRKKLQKVQDEQTSRLPPPPAPSPNA